MAKVEYKDVPVYFAHVDGTTTDTTVVNNIIDTSVASGSIKTAIDKSATSVKSWADNKFQTK